MVSVSDAYELLHAEDQEVVLIIGRQCAKRDLATEEAFGTWGRCPCRRHWDGLLCEVADQLSQYLGPTRDHVTKAPIRGRIFRVWTSRSRACD